jgi:hypothetical protein
VIRRPSAPARLHNTIISTLIDAATHSPRGQPEHLPVQRRCDSLSSRPRTPPEYQVLAFPPHPRCRILFPNPAPHSNAPSLCRPAAVSMRRLPARRHSCSISPPASGLLPGASYDFKKWGICYRWWQGKVRSVVLFEHCINHILWILCW